MEVKTLLERAKPALLERLKDFSQEYPNTGDYITAGLNERYFVSDLPYGIVIDLEGMFPNKVSVWDMFLPAY